MIKVTDINGREHYLALSAIAQVSEAGASSAWHGIRSYVTTFAQRVIEARETPAEILRSISDARSQEDNDNG